MSTHFSSRHFARVAGTRAHFCTAVILMASAIAWITLTPADAGAGVVTAAYPQSYIDINTGYVNNYPYNTGWGSWFTHQGSNGLGTTSYDGFGVVQTRQDVNMLHAGYHNAAPTTGVINKGALEFTTTNTFTAYQIDGIIPLEITTGPGASGFANLALTLKQVSGPTLASYSVNQTFGGNTEFALIAFDASSPLTGAQSGSLLTSTTYRMEWFFQVSMTHNGGPASNIDIAPSSPSYFQIAFVPEPSSALAAMGAAALVLRRRRRPCPRA
ncbi:MAG: hypothetical protein QOF78_3941 [Phycisphaerales bacterium]|jgi:MYXO-CTERM domain-containing protein|nr:hypothetical protein [Phycisphaerales bacterium]